MPVPDVEFLTVDVAGGGDEPEEAGMHADVTLKVARDKPGVIVPAESTVFAGGKLRVAVLKADGRVTWRDVALKRDFGKVLELDGGVDADSRIIVGPPPDLREDQPVERDDGPKSPSMRSAAR